MIGVVTVNFSVLVNVSRCLLTLQVNVAVNVTGIGLSAWNSAAMVAILPGLGRSARAPSTVTYCSAGISRSI